MALSRLRSPGQCLLLLLVSVSWWLLPRRCDISAFSERAVSEPGLLESTDCISTPAAFADAFRSHCASGAPRSRCVTRLVGHIQGSDPPTHLGSLPRRVGFAVGDASLEKALIFGCGRMRAFIASLGFGTVPLGMYHLVVWRQAASPEMTRCHWEKLEEMLHRAYGDTMPAGVGAAVNDLRLHSFHNITGCEPSALAHAPSDYAAAGCSREFAEAVTVFSLDAPGRGCDIDRGLCAGEERLMARARLSAVELRAFLYAALDFNPFFTGNSYTAEGDAIPREREFWFINRPLSTLSASEHTVVQLNVR